MPFTVDQLISEHQKLVTVKPEDSVKVAMELMIKHDFSQLPVVDDSNTLLGLVTADSVLRAMMFFGATVRELQVIHVKVPTQRYFAEDELFELLDDLKVTPAVVVVDSEAKAIGVVTSSDTMEYFRSRAQDMMYLEDIESALKEYITSAFSNGQGETDNEALSNAIRETTQSDAEARRVFNKALGHYLSDGATEKFDANKAKKIFDEDFPKAVSKGYEDLTLGEFSQMLLHDSIWPKVGHIFSLDKSALYRLLDDVRKTRNALFHFRGEISPSQRMQLQFCSDWLNSLRSLVPSAVTTATESESAVVVAHATEGSIGDGPGTGPSAPEERPITPVEDEGSADSRYAALAQHLRMMPGSDSSTTLTFEQVEAIIGDRLPAFALQHRSWWANDSVSHVQSRQWLEAGWRVHRISITDQRVTFARNREREQQYIVFFGGVSAGLEGVRNFPVKAASPKGVNWQNVAVLPSSGPQLAVFSFSFAFHGRYRAELYIDTWDKARNKRVFDELFAIRFEIEPPVGEPVVWERLDSKRACRVALYHPGAITGTAEELAELRTWSIDAMCRLYFAIAGPAQAALLRTAPE